MKEFKQPWTYEYRNECFYSGDNESFAEWFVINDKDGKEVVGELNNIEDEKLASLIAAAPELLEALQNILDPMTTYLPSTSEESKNAWAAINKALGEK